MFATFEEHNWLELSYQNIFTLSVDTVTEFDWNNGWYTGRFQFELKLKLKENCWLELIFPVDGYTTSTTPYDDCNL